MFISLNRTVKSENVVIISLKSCKLYWHSIWKNVFT